MFAQSICCCLRPVAHLDSVPSWLRVGFPALGRNEDTVKSHPSGCRSGHCRRKWPRALPPAQVLRDRTELLLPGAMVIPQSSFQPPFHPHHTTSNTFPSSKVAAHRDRVSMAKLPCWASSSSRKQQFHLLTGPRVRCSSRCTGLRKHWRTQPSGITGNDVTFDNYNILSLSCPISKQMDYRRE